MDSNIVNFEKEILDMVISALEKNHSKFIEAGIIRKTIQFKRDFQAKKYLSEIQVNFWDESGIFDVMEFFVYDDSRPSATKEQFKDWVNDFLEELFREKNH